MKELKTLNQFVESDNGLLNVLTGCVVSAELIRDKTKGISLTANLVESGNLKLSFDSGGTHEFIIDKENVEKFISTMRKQSAHYD